MGHRTPYLHNLFSNSNHNTAVTRFTQQIQHLRLDDYFDKVEDRIGLNTLLNTATNLLSLDIVGTGEYPAQLVLDKIKFCQPLPLKFLDLHCISISSNHLLGLLEKCKESIRLLSLDYVSLSSGSWLHVLSQINKKLNLYLFLWHFEVRADGEEEEHQDLERPLELFDEQDMPKLNWCAHGDINRQTHVNRLAAGVESDATTDDYLSRPPLKSVMSETQYQELISRSWDFEEHSNEW